MDMVVNLGLCISNCLSNLLPNLRILLAKLFALWNLLFFTLLVPVFDLLNQRAQFPLNSLHFVQWRRQPFREGCDVCHFCRVLFPLCSQFEHFQDLKNTLCHYCQCLQSTLGPTIELVPVTFVLLMCGFFYGSLSTLCLKYSCILRRLIGSSAAVRLGWFFVLRFQEGRWRMFF